NVEERGDVVGAKHCGGVVEDLLIRGDLGEAGAGLLGDALRQLPMGTFKYKQRIAEIRRLADRRERAKRMQRKASAQARQRAARMKDDGFRRGDRSGDLLDGPVAHGDENQLSGSRQVVDGRGLDTE